jgi:hypothetical protein
LYFLQTGGGTRLASVPQAFEAPAAGQDSLQAEQAKTDKPAEEAQTLGGGAAGAVGETPSPSSLRAAGPTLETDAITQTEAPPMAQAAPQMASTETPAEFAANAGPSASQVGDAERPPRVEANKGADLIRWSEVLLAAGLVLLLTVQIKRRR